MIFDQNKFCNMLEDLLKYKHLEENLSKIVRDIESEFEFHSLGIFLKNLKTLTYRLKISRNISHAYEKNTWFTEDDSLIRELYAFKPLNLNPDSSYRFEHDYSNLLVMPLYNNYELLGFLFLDRQYDNYSKADIVKLKIFTSVISMVVSLVNQRYNIEQMTDLDELTGIYNCHAFYDRAEKMLSHARRYQRDLTIAAMKIDNFENIVRTIGKDNTDDLLKNLAVILKNNLRETDLVGRLYRDTFAIAMPETHENISLIAVYRINDKIIQLPLMNHYRIGWGILEKSSEISDIEDYINKTIEAAFESTRKGDDNITVYRV
ncbi:MAG: GGDEF domain-containing protein [Candidatus Cloacimonetes bacterium]|nr:GGDEF domain-containing protein [Candidatus Cloacimonadota bacterium]